MADGWGRNDNGLHDFDQLGLCKTCDSHFLDAAGYCAPDGPPTARDSITPPAGMIPSPTPRTPVSDSAGPAAAGTFTDLGLDAAFDGQDHPHRIRCIHHTLTLQVTVIDPYAGKWLSGYDLDACDGHGYTCWSRDETLAMVFPTLRAAWETWQLTPPRRPFSGSGQPNRPLTHFSVEFVAA